MATQQLNAIIKVTDQASGPLKKVGSSLGSFASKMGGIVTGLGALGAIGGSAMMGLGLATIGTAGKFEKFQSILTNTLGSVGQATQAMALLKDVSSKTPFELDKLTESYIKLVNRGFKPTREQIINLGDLAASQGKQFDMLTEALLDAQTGEFERLKEFGVKAQVSGDKVAFTFKGVTTTVGKTDEAIKNYILSLGSLKGIQGSMAVQSETYEGKLSNLKDAWTNLSASIGEKFLPASKKGISALTETINKLNDGIKTVSDWGESSNGYILLVAGAFEQLSQQGNGLPSLSHLFSGAMDGIKKSALFVIPGIGQLTMALKGLLNLAGIDVGKMVVNAAQNAVTSKASQIAASIGSQQGVLSKLQSSGSLAISPDFAMTKINAKVAELNSKLKTSAAGLGGVKGSSGSGPDKAKEMQIAQEKELIKVTDDRIKQVNQLGISEAKKAQLIIQINDEMQAELKRIRGDDQQDNFTYFDEIATKAKEKLEVVKDKFKSIYGAVKDAISKSKDEVGKLEDKIKDGLDKIQKLQESITNLGKDTQTSLTDRYVEASKELADTKLGAPDTVEETIKMQNRMADLQNELSFIAGKVGKNDLDKALEFDKLSQAEKLVALAEAKKAELQVQIDSEVEKVKLLEDQRKSEIEKMTNFNIAKAKVEKDYTTMFKEQLNERETAYADFIRNLESLSGGSKVVDGLVATELTGNRALGGTIMSGRSYLVGERGPELVTPSSTSRVSNQVGGSSTININMGGVTVKNEGDMEMMVEKVRRMLINEAKLYRNGIT